MTRYSPNWVVSVDITDNFKTRLDKHWHIQDIIYDFTAVAWNWKSQ